MKHLGVFIFKAALCAAFASVALSCATAKPDFIPVQTAKQDNAIEVSVIEDYENIMKKNKIKIVYYTDQYFFIYISGTPYVLYTRGYKNFHDYKEGKLAVPEENTIFKPGYPLRRRD
jgi:hypothetical protein